MTSTTPASERIPHLGKVSHLVAPARGLPLCGVVSVLPMMAEVRPCTTPRLEDAGYGVGSRPRSEILDVDADV